MKRSKEPRDWNGVEVFDVPLAAEFLMINRVTLLKLLADGKIVGQRIGRPWRIHRAELEAFLRRPAATATEPNGNGKAREKLPRGARRA